MSNQNNTHTEQTQEEKSLSDSASYFQKRAKEVSEKFEKQEKFLEDVAKLAQIFSTKFMNFNNILPEDKIFLTRYENSRKSDIEVERYQNLLTKFSNIPRNIVKLVMHDVFFDSCFYNILCGNVFFEKSKFETYESCSKKIVDTVSNTGKLSDTAMELVVFDNLQTAISALDNLTKEREHFLSTFKTHEKMSQNSYSALKNYFSNLDLSGVDFMRLFQDVVPNSYLAYTLHDVSYVDLPVEKI